MKEMTLKWIPLFLVVVISTLIIFMETTNNHEISAPEPENKIEQKINQILAANEDKTLQIQKELDDKCIYLEFVKDNGITSYFVDTKTGEETDFLEFIRADKIEEFNQKINDLIYLKYPKFIADVLILPETKRVYQIKENELIIYFSDVVTEPMVNESLFLTVNYHEIKDFLDFTLLLDSEYQNEDGYHYDTNKKTVALTFDDGPNGARTNTIVDLLEQNKAHATFFMVGNKMSQAATTIQNVLAKGNEIGSHSYNHANLKRQKLEDVIAGEEQTKTIYRNITGQELIYTRPPYGTINTQIKDSLDTIFITWNLDTEDWLHRDKNYIIDYVLNNVSDGDIILMHDSYDSTVEAVRELLPKLYSEGYQVVSVSELAKITNHPLEKHAIYRSLKRSSQ